MRQAINYLFLLASVTVTVSETVNQEDASQKTISDYTGIEQCEIEHGKLKIMLDRMLDKVTLTRAESLFFKYLLFGVYFITTT